MIRSPGVRLSEQILRFFGRVEVALVGADGDLRDAEEALAQGDAIRARSAAHAVLSRVPKSPIGLALLADACELGGLDAELALTLEELADRLGSRADVWLRLAAARIRTGAERHEVREALLRGLAVAEPGSDTRRELLLRLADLDLEDGDGARADLWLDRLFTDHHPSVLLRRAEVRTLQGRLDDAEGLLADFANDPANGRAALALGRIRAARGEASAYLPLLRAYLLDRAGAGPELRRALERIPPDPETLARVHAVCAGKGEANDDRWRAAFFRTEGKLVEAREALRRAAAAGDDEAAESLVQLSICDHDVPGLQAGLAFVDSRGTHSPVERDAKRLLGVALAPREAEAALASLDVLAGLETEAAASWGDRLRADLLRVVLPEGGTASWDLLLARHGEIARSVGDLAVLSQLGELALERTRPLRLAVVGEFNAGKSTFLNALLGQDVAPTGILPTTATLHYVRYAPDPLARILLEDPDRPGAYAAPERLVALGELRATLATLDTGHVRRVEILVPLPSLTRMEILDTPGFNAPDPRHSASARDAFQEADVILWLFDAAQALKDTERSVLEEAKAAKLPMQILVNKSDRLKPSDLELVLTTLKKNLDDIGIQTLAPPLALSARLALKGRLGDADALAASGFDAVQRLIDETLLSRSAELKERALRRRFAGVVATLEAAVQKRAEQAREREESQLRVRAHGRQLAAQIEVELEELAPALVALVGPAFAAWQRDVSTALIGRDRAQAEKDPAHARYVVDRALVYLAPALARATASLATGELPLGHEQLAGMARAVVRTYAPQGLAAPLLPAARAYLLTAAEELVRQGLGKDAPDPVTLRLAELHCLRAVVSS